MLYKGKLHDALDEEICDMVDGIQDIGVQFSCKTTEIEEMSAEELRILVHRYHMIFDYLWQCIKNMRTLLKYLKE